MKHLSALNKYFWKYRWHFVLGFIFVVLTNYFRILAPQLTGYVVNTVVESIKSPNEKGIDIKKGEKNYDFTVRQVITQFDKNPSRKILYAGITLFGDFLTYPPESFARVMQVNLAGSFFLAQAAAIEMKKQGFGGSILFMSSVTGHQAHKNLAAYGMTKAALEMLAKNLVIELSPYQITVNAIAPGATLTERTMEDPNYKTMWDSLTPLGRPASVSDITDAALFLVSEKAKHITGQSLVIDGGWTSISPQPF